MGKEKGKKKRKGYSPNYFMLDSGLAKGEKTPIINLFC